jgi:hypothetical protein
LRPVTLAFLFMSAAAAQPIAVAQKKVGFDEQFTVM